MGYCVAVETKRIDAARYKALREVVDSQTLRLNLKEPQVAVPEHLFHYPLAILDPEEGVVVPIDEKASALEVVNILKRAGSKVALLSHRIHRPCRRVAAPGTR